MKKLSRIQGFFLDNIILYSMIDICDKERPIYKFYSEWDQPPTEMRPPGSISIKVCIGFLRL
jgi:hypothetical protein